MTEHDKMKEERKFQLESHLHEKYGDNFNSHVGAFVTVLGIIFVMFTALGYLYAHSSVESWDSFATDEFSYTMHHYFLLSILVSGVLFFVSCLCSMFSFMERRDQCINMLLRNEYGVSTGYESPLTLTIENFMPEFYKLFFVMLQVSQWVVIAMTLLKIGCYWSAVDEERWTWWLILPLFSVVMAVVMIFMSRKSRSKYYDDLEKYKEKLLKDWGGSVQSYEL